MHYSICGRKQLPKNSRVTQKRKIIESVTLQVTLRLQYNGRLMSATSTFRRKQITTLLHETRLFPIYKMVANVHNAYVLYQLPHSTTHHRQPMKRVHFLVEEIFKVIERSICMYEYTRLNVTVVATIFVI